MDPPFQNLGDSFYFLIIAKLFVYHLQSRYCKNGKVGNHGQSNAITVQFAVQYGLFLSL